MLRAAVGFFILAFLALVFGATGLAGLSMEVGKTLVLALLVLALISGLIGLVRGRSPKNMVRATSE